MALPEIYFAGDQQRFRRLVCGGSSAANPSAVARTRCICQVRALAAKSGHRVVEPNCPVLCGFSCHNLVQPDATRNGRTLARQRSEEHTSELQSLTNLVCRLL